LSGRFYIKNGCFEVFLRTTGLLSDNRMGEKGHFTRSHLLMVPYNSPTPLWMKNNKLRMILLALALFVLIVLPLSSASAAESGDLPAFSGFIAAVVNGRAREVRGVYVPGTLALRVLQQPQDDPGFVLPMDGVATQFRLAARNRVIGLLAHNDLAGAEFSGLKIGQEVRVVYGNGRVEYYRINRLARFQVLQPGSQQENYEDLNSNATYSAQEIFSIFYDGDAHVTFQTCLLRDGNSSWGRLFVTAIPVPSYVRMFQALTPLVSRDFGMVGDRIGLLIGDLGLR
jgi:hypothetical protein